MGISTIDAGMLKNAFLAGAKGLEAKKDWINELNVFPVPDGDTGTNMTLTIMAAAREVAELENPTMDQLAKAISSGSLRGARGNSGVILSQLLRGFTKEIKAVEEIDTTILANAMVRGTETAYKAVMKPKEGTILTVAKAMADKGLEMASQTDDMEEFVKEVIEYGDYVLGQTPEMLPVLKQAGVVDSGGQGLIEVLSGAVDFFLGKEIDLSLSVDGKAAQAQSGKAGGDTRRQAEAEVEIKFGYCTEFIIMLNKPFNIKAELDFKAFLESIGDSIVCVADEDVVKVHVHTNDPGLAIQKALTYGALSNMKIDNMRLEHQEKLFKMSAKESGKTAVAENALKPEAPAGTAETSQTAPEEPLKDYGFIAVSAGEGMSEIFRSLGVDHIIEGGQTMNPSTADILEAVEKVNARTVFVLPNNKNIILAANQAAELTAEKDLLVIPTKTIPQGITAVINFVPDMSADENEANMISEIKKVSTGEVTYAVRDTVIDDKEIRKGDFMGIGDKGILAVGGDISGVAKDTIAGMVKEDSELISIYYGSDINEADAEGFRTQIAESYPDCDIELQYGGQPIYYYIMSVE